MDILYPRRCPVCDEIIRADNLALICDTCRQSLSYVKGPTCRKCGREVFSDMTEYCFNCTSHKRTYEYGLALLNYNETARHAVIKIKYKNKREYLEFFADEIYKKYGDIIRNMHAQALIPVPVHILRKKQRGYNQAELLAELLGERFNMPVLSDILIRNKKTLPQKILSPAERLKNLEQAFMVEHTLPGLKSVILIDDIYTTGSTVEACTRALKKAGVEKVYFVTISIVGGE